MAPKDTQPDETHPTDAPEPNLTPDLADALRSIEAIGAGSEAPE